MRINSNIPALNAQRNLSRTTQALSRALSRLSSGQRVNEARDDAAGLAIGEGLNSQVRGLRQIALNINQAFGYLETADGILSTQIDLVQRMKELAVQAASGTMSTEDRLMLDGELQTLLAEFERVSESATFNGTHLLDGSMGTISLQVGLHKGETIDFRLEDSRGSAIFTNVSTVGTGRFEEDQSLSMAEGPYFFQYSGDADNDGDEDFIVSDYNTGDYTLFRQGENHEFESEALNLGSGYVEWGDLNNDGRVDLVKWFGGQSIVMLQNESGTFASPQTLNFANPDLQDYDGDGDLDLVSYLTSSAQVALNDGHGNFSIGAALSFGAATATIDEDINGDGILDAVSVQGVNNRVLYALGTASGGFTTIQTLNLGAGYTSIRFGDFNGDGIKDVVGLHSSTGSAVIRIGSSSGNFSVGTTQATAANYAGLLETQDVNGDGFDDLFIASDSANSIAVRLSDGTGGFSVGTTIAVAGGFYSSVFDTNDHFADLDGDGNVDLVSADTGVAAIHWGNGQGGFASSTTVSIDNPYNMRIADMNNDGQLDLISQVDYLTSSATSAQFQLNQGNRTFAGGGIQSSLSSVLNVDLNGDGSFDYLMSQDGSVGFTGFFVYFQETMQVEEAATIHMRTQEEAQDLLSVFDRALDHLSERRAKIGATVSRLESALTTTSIAMENLSAARSQIMDLDIASEVAETVRLQILQQAQVSVIAQANLNLAMVLSLLRP